MKTYFTISAAAVVFLSACNAPQGATSRAVNDDIYYSSKDAAAEKKPAPSTPSGTTTATTPENRASSPSGTNAAQPSAPATTDDYYQNSEKRKDSDGDTYVTNNYYDQPFNYDDYYDYAYSTRIRRFHHYTPSYGYYDNYYTNSYWYSGDPYTYGCSVYLGYSWWGPSYISYSYNPRVYWYASFGWGYDPWYHPCGYSGYHHGYYGSSYWGYNSGYWGYNPYMHGYNNGYWNGYHDGYYNSYYNGWYGGGYYNNAYNNNYFNSYDNNSYYYGPRQTTGSNGRMSSQPVVAASYADHMTLEGKNTGLNGRDDRRTNEIENGRNVGTPVIGNPSPDHNPNDPSGRGDKTLRPDPSTINNNNGTNTGITPEPPVKNRNDFDKPGTIDNTRPADKNDGLNPTPPVKPRDNNNIQNGESHSPGNDGLKNVPPRNDQPYIDQPRNTQPAPVPPRNEQRYEQPRDAQPAPVVPRNEQRYEQPRSSQPVPSAPRNEQRYEQPRNSQPAPSAPRNEQRYEQPRNSAPSPSAPRNNSSNRSFSGPSNGPRR